MPHGKTAVTLALALVLTLSGAAPACAETSLSGQVALGLDYDLDTVDFGWYSRVLLDCRLDETFLDNALAADCQLAFDTDFHLEGLTIIYGDAEAFSLGAVYFDEPGASKKWSWPLSFDEAEGGASLFGAVFSAGAGPARLWSGPLGNGRDIEGYWFRAAYAFAGGFASVYTDADFMDALGFMGAARYAGPTLGGGLAFTYKGALYELMADGFCRFGAVELAAEAFYGNNADPRLGAALTYLHEDTWLCGLGAEYDFTVQGLSRVAVLAATGSLRAAGYYAVNGMQMGLSFVYAPEGNVALELGYEMDATGYAGWVNNIRGGIRLRF